MSRKAPNTGNGRRLRLMPLNILGGGPIIIDVDEEERKRQKRRLERAQAIIEAEALKQAQEQALALVQAQARQAEEEEQKKQENREQSPSQAAVADTTVPASPAQSTATIRIRESKDELLGTRTIEFRIDEKNSQGTPDSKKGDTGDGTATAKVDGVDNAAASKPAREKNKDGAKKTSKKSSWVTYLDESGSSSSREDGDADADDDTDVSTKADDGLEHHIRHLATRLCIGNDGDKPAQKATRTGASTSKHQGRRRRRSSHSRQRHQMHFFSDFDNTRGTREVRLEAYSKKGDKAGDEERRKRQPDEKSNETAAGEPKLDETSPSKDDVPRFLPAPPSSQNGQQDLAVNDPGDDHDVHRDRFLRSRSFRGHYLETLPPPPGRPAVDFYGHPVPSYASPYAPYPAYPSAYVPLPPPPPPPLYHPYHAQAPYAAYGPGPPPPPPEHTPYYYDHHHRRASDYQYAPAPYAPHAPTPPSPRSPARHHSSGSVHSGPASGRPQRDGASGQQQSRRLKNALPYGGGDKAGTWHDPDAAGQAAGGSDTAWNKPVDWETTNNKSKHAKGTKDQENNKSSNDLDNWGIRWDNNDSNNENHDDAGKHKNKGKDAEKMSQGSGNGGWASWNAEENKSSKGDSGWPGWDTDKTKDMDNNGNNNSNKSWAGWGAETKKGDGNSGKSGSGWAGWDTGSNEAKGQSRQGQASNNSNNGDNDNIWGLGGDGADDNGAGEYAGDFARGGDTNDLWSGGNNMATMAEDDNIAAGGSGNNTSAPPGAWPPSDGCEMQQPQQAESSQGGNVAW